MTLEQFISEAHKDYEDLASEKVKRAVDIAAEAAKTPLSVHEEGMGIKKEAVAKYKIEIMFDNKRSSKEAVRCLMSVWESGKRLHGGGDESMFWCRDSRKGEKAGCGSVIPNAMVKKNIAYCPHCKKAVNTHFLSTFRPVERTHQQIAKILERVFLHLNSDADIYMKYYKEELAKVTDLRAKGDDYVAPKRVLAIYPLKNILKDVGNGASLEGRFLAFLSS